MKQGSRNPGSKSTPEQNTRRKAKKRTGRRWFRSLLLFLILGVIALTGVAAAAGYTIYMQTDVSSLYDGGRPTIIYDRNGNPYEELSNSRIDFVPLSEIPQHVRDAIVAIEDARFNEHIGVDIVGIGRALVRNILEGDIVQGGSTITQQLAKNKYLSLEQTFSRKFKEAILALKIERNYSKDEILEQYLNTNYYGEGAWGIQNAAQTYFGKNVQDLTLEESALLAAVLKAPSHYSPVKDPAKAKDRRNLVLEKMAEYGYITDEERSVAANTEIVLTAAASVTANSGTTSSYADHVIAEAIELTGLTEQEILSGGYHIYTHLDPNMQAAADEVYSQNQYFPEGDPEKLQSGMAIVDSRSGGILALAGQRGTKQYYRGFNYATQTKRQPGSSIKPIVSYAPALMEGYRMNDMIHDVRTDFNGYVPQNYGGRFHGWVTMERALAESHNIPAVAMLMEVGIDKGMKLAREAGIPLADEDRTLALALGGVQTGVSPLQMAQAYTMFANEGVMSEAYAITEIKNREWRTVYRAEASQKQLITPEAAYEMTLMLQKAVNEGTGTSARMNRPVAGKTGTTQLPDIPRFQGANGRTIDGTRDAWFVGYTPDVVGAVWLGYTSNNGDEYLTSTGGSYPARIFKEVIERGLAGQPASNFTRPQGYQAPGWDVQYINGTPPLRQEDDLDEAEEDLDTEDHASDGEGSDESGDTDDGRDPDGDTDESNGSQDDLLPGNNGHGDGTDEHDENRLPGNSDDADADSGQSDEPDTTDPEDGRNRLNDGAENGGSGGVRQPSNSSGSPSNEEGRAGHSSGNNSEDVPIGDTGNTG